MEEILDKIIKGLQEGATSAIGKAEDLTRLAGSRLEIAAAKNKITQLETQLGSLVYSQFESGKDSANSTQELCEEIGEVKSELAALEREYEELRAELADRKSAPDATDEEV